MFSGRGEQKCIIQYNLQRERLPCIYIYIYVCLSINNNINIMSIKSFLYALFDGVHKQKRIVRRPDRINIVLNRLNAFIDIFYFFVRASIRYYILFYIVYVKQRRHMIAAAVRTCIYSSGHYCTYSDLWASSFGQDLKRHIIICRCACGFVYVSM